VQEMSHQISLAGVLQIILLDELQQQAQVVLDFHPACRTGQKKSDLHICARSP
jgi:hypothetical protein